MRSVSRAIIGIALVGATLTGGVTEASAARARQLYSAGHGYGYHGGAYRHHYGRYGNPAVGAAVAGTALGIVGLAAGAAAANSYGGYGYGYGPGPGYYGAPGYYTPGYAPGYEPDEDLF